MHYLYGTTGIPNYGDELIAANWLRYLVAIDGDVIIDCHSPERSHAFLERYNPKARHVRVVGRLMGQALRKYPNASFWEHMKIGREFFRAERIPGWDLGILGELLPRLTHFHLIGGGYISDRWPQSGFLLGFAAAAHERYGLTLYGTGLGILPLSPPSPKDLPLLREVVEAFALIELRDQEGADLLLSQTGRHDIVKAGLDDAFLLPVSHLTPERSDTPALHISWHLPEDRLPKLVEVAKSALTKGMKVFFWRCHSERDLVQETALRKYFPEMQTFEQHELVANCPSDQAT